MPLHLYNTLTNRDEVFRPLRAGAVSFYSCGPTVYDFAHIGNFRTFIASDLLRRWLESPLCQRVTPDGELDADPIERLAESLAALPEDSDRDRSSSPAPGGYRVAHVMNITDVGHMTDDDQADGEGEDKMEAARQRLLESKKANALPADAPADLDPNDPYDIAGFYADAFVSDAYALGIRLVEQAVERASGDPSKAASDELLPRATAAIGEILALIIELLDAEAAYVSGDAVYFDTARFPDYGTLSGNTLEKIRSGAGGRVDQVNQAAKRHPADFMLWKHDPRHLMKWNPTEVLPEDLARRAASHGLRLGYPGWHVECSAMARTRLGDEIDIHSGGEDLIFPHHECEIAQSRCVTHREHFARYWMHVRFLQVEGQKMSKSAGNFYTAREILERGFTPGALRLALLGAHYRQNLNFTANALNAAETTVGRWSAFLEAAGSSQREGEPDAEVARRFAEAMNDDLNVAEAVATINSWIKRTSEPRRADAKLLRAFDRVLSVVRLSGTNAPEFARSGADDLADRVERLMAERQRARAAKDFATADRIRDELDELGVEIVDTPDGSTWKRKVEL